MAYRSGALPPEDYVEPRCVLCDEPYGAAPAVKAVPQQRIIEKMNEYMSRRDYDGAERHLLYWLEEARLGGDRRGELMLQNELVGHYRKTGDKTRSLAAADAALELLDELDFSGTISAGTTCVNAATACNAFGENERSLALFEKARSVYESLPRTAPELLGGLYNNMALTCGALGRYDEALSLYEKAMAQMEKVPSGKLEQAITCLNIANTLEAQLGMEAAEERIFALTDRAYALLDDPALPRDGYYAFVCEKCAPSFSYYGCFLAAEELQSRAEAIYERA
ncbi:MAG: tetratricopeptide repeat protein [Oscillospiraceae bacterium]|nr:tetratricopeptide repeat protein [Oscillospiraceae bacterium]